jgi:hypothetical protein
VSSGGTLAKYLQARSLAYADDAYINAKLSVALQVLADLKYVLEEDGDLELNVSKTVILPKGITQQTVFDAALRIINSTPSLTALNGNDERAKIQSLCVCVCVCISICISSPGKHYIYKDMQQLHVLPVLVLLAGTEACAPSNQAFSQPGLHLKSHLPDREAAIGCIFLAIYRGTSRSAYLTDSFFCFSCFFSA